MTAADVQQRPLRTDAPSAGLCHRLLERPLEGDSCTCMHDTHGLLTRHKDQLQLAQSKVSTHCCTKLDMHAQSAAGRGSCCCHVSIEQVETEACYQFHHKHDPEFIGQKVMSHHCIWACQEPCRLLFGMGCDAEQWRNTNSHKTTVCVTTDNTNCGTQNNEQNRQQDLCVTRPQHHIHAEGIISRLWRHTK